MKKDIPLFLAKPEISKHEEKIIEFFGGYQAVKADIAKSIEDIHGGRELPATVTIVICFTNRSGSNLLAEGIATNSNAVLGGEYFNYPTVINFCKRLGIHSFSEYCMRLQRHKFGKKKDRVFCTKLGQSQLYFLTKMKILPHLLPNPRFILIKRRDVLAQAVSFSIAYQTKKWKSSIEGEGSPVVFRENDITNRVEAIVKSNASFEEYFALTGERCFQIYYEDLVEDFGGKMSEAITNLGLELTGAPEYSALSLKRQATSINQQFADRMRQTCSLYRTDPPEKNGE